MVQPRESSHFSFYAEGSGHDIQPYNETTLYTEDRIGLKSMVEGGKVDFLSIPGNHLQFTQEWFKDVVIAKYLQ